MYEVPSGRIVWFRTSPDPRFGHWRLGVVYTCYMSKKYEIRTMEGRRFPYVEPRHVILRLGDLP